MNTSDGPRGPWPDPDERGEARPDPGEPEDARAEDERLHAEAEAIGSDAAAVAADLGAASDRFGGRAVRAALGELDHGGVEDVLAALLSAATNSTGCHAT